MKQLLTPAQILARMCLITITMLVFTLLSPTPPSAARSSQPPLSNRVGVILPLTGKFAHPGIEVKRGLDLAFESFPPAHAGALELIYRDTQDSPEATAKAIRELVEDQRVIAIIGPMVSATADTAANTAADLGVPLIILSQKSGIPHLGRVAFRNFMTSETQMRALVDYSMKELGMQRFAIAFPEQRYGMELAALFWDEVVLRGGRINSAESYTPGTADFLNLAKKVGGKYYDEIRRQEYAKVRAEVHSAYKQAGKPPPNKVELPPLVDFEGIFIPDQPKVATMIAASLAYTEMPLGRFLATHGQPQVRMMGISSWNSPELSLKGVEYVDGSLFVDQFFPDSADPIVRSFCGQFQKLYQKTPDAFAAVGYDAFGFLNGVLQKKISSHEELIERIKRFQEYDGVTGKINFNDRGELTRPPFVLTVRRQQIRQLYPLVEETGVKPGGKSSDSTTPHRAPQAIHGVGSSP